MDKKDYLIAAYRVHAQYIHDHSPYKLLCFEIPRLTPNGVKNIPITNQKEKFDYIKSRFYKKYSNF